MGFLDYDVEISKIIRSTNAIESLNATTDAPCEPEDTSRPDKPRSSASTSSHARTPHVAVPSPPANNNPTEADHGRLTSRLRSMRGLTRLCRARVISTGPAFVRNLRRGHDELGSPGARTDELLRFRTVSRPPTSTSACDEGWYRIPVR
jgi:hypothetical protein